MYRGFENANTMHQNVSEENDVEETNFVPENQVHKKTSWNLSNRNRQLFG